MTITSGIADRLDSLLPQTQCTRCGFPACRPYAQAIAEGEADIDRCPPGGDEGVAALAHLLGRAAKRVDPAFGRESAPTIAVIDEAACIGCTKCIQACPVDAIVGAAKRMHAILDAECTGCELCIAPCPVDCITMQPIAAAPLGRDAVLARALHARRRFDARGKRLERDAAGREARRAPPAAGNTAAPAPISRDAVMAAIARGKARRLAGRVGGNGTPDA
jgi:electron transport complex protein RnfB